MTWQISFFTFSLLLSAGLALSIAQAAWRQSLGIGREALTLLMLAVSAWSLSAFFEQMATGNSAKILWSKIEYIGILSAPVLFFLLALEISSQQRWVNRRITWTLWVIPLISLLLIATNEWHGWFWSAITAQPGAGELSFRSGPWSLVVIEYSYLLMGGGFLALGRAVFIYQRALRRQAIIVLLGAFFPILANIWYLVQVNSVTRLDLTPQAFTLSGLVLIWGIGSFKFLNPLPVARSKILETITEAVMVLDHQNRVAYVNPVACQLLQTSLDSVTGLPASQVLKTWPYLVRRFTQNIETPTESLEIKSDRGRWYDLRISPLKDEKGVSAGWLIMLNDITHRKHIELDLATLVNDLQTVFEVSTTLAATLDPSHLLQQIVDLTQSRFNIYHAQIYLFDAPDQKLILAAGSGSIGRQMISDEASGSTTQALPLVARVVLSRQGEIANNVADEPGFVPQPLLPETRSELAVPIMTGEALLGVLDVQDNRPDRFTQRDLEVLITLAAQISVALNNARTFEQLQVLLESRNKELDLMYDFGKKINEGVAIPELMEWTAGRLPFAMRFPEDCSIWIEYDGKQFGNMDALHCSSQVSHPLLNANQNQGRLVAAYLDIHHFSPEERNLLVNTCQRLENFIIDETIHTQRSQLQETLQIASMGHFEYDFRSNTALLSDELFHILGSSVEKEGGYQVLPTIIDKYVDPTEAHRILAEVGLSITAEEVNFLEHEVRFFRHSEKGTEERNGLFRARVERDRQGNPFRLLGTLQDITERVKTEEQIRRLATVIDQAKETIVITDPQGKIVYVNPHFETITGYSISEVMGKNPRILKSGMHDRAFYQNLWQTILSGRTWNGTFINRRKDGNLYHEAATIFPINSSDGNIINFAAVKRDISAQVKAEFEIQQASRQQALLTEITLTALEQTDMPRMLQALADRISELLQADGCFITLWDEDKKIPVDSAASGIMSEALDALMKPEQGVLSLIKAVLDLNHTLVIEDIFSSPYISLMTAAKYPARSLVGLPLTASGRRFGAVLITYRQPRRFSNEEIAIYERSTAQISLALIKAWLVEAEQHQRLLAETLQESGQVLSSVLEFNQLLDLILVQIQHIVPYDSGSLFMLEGNVARSVRSHGYDKYGARLFGQMAQMSFDLSQTTTLNRIARTRQPLIIPDVIEYPGWIPIPIEVRSWIGAPILAQDQVIGFLSLEKVEVNYYNSDHATRLKSFLGQVSLALQNARLFETARRRATEAETLRLAGAAITSTLELEEIIEIILEQLNFVVPYDSASVLFLHDKYLEIVGGRGFPDPSIILGLQFDIDGDNPSAVVYDTQKPFILDNVQEKYSVFKVPPHDRIRSWLGVPLILQNRVTGMIALDSEKIATFTQDHARLASAYADQVAIALENARLFEQVQKLAITDPLTGLYNRRFFFSQAKSEFERSRRYQEPLSIIILDIDDFKKVNDTYGHPIGDQVLQAVARLCKENVREIDVVGRYGGEEFVILLPETPLVVLQPSRPGTTPFSESGMPNWGAVAAAERLRSIIAATTIHTDQVDLQVTISLGVAEYTAELNSPEALLDQADQELYNAKKSGKNRVAYS